jgi:ArsR family transcriptional regulator, arsenate/arsenite/antimonite-responsive transcriptional repressor
VPKQLWITDVSAGACCTPIVDEPLSESVAVDLAKGFKALGDPVRLRLLSLIAVRAGAEVCVCDLTEAFAVTGPTISHHLKVLREAGLIDCQRRGTWVYYWIIPAALTALSQRLDTSALATTTAGPAA